MTNRPTVANPPLNTGVGELVLGLRQTAYVLKSIANGDDQRQIARKCAGIADQAADAIASLTSPASGGEHPIAGKYGHLLIDGYFGDRATAEASSDERAQIVAGEWQPIETAPKEECRILAWDGFSVFVAYWYGQRFAFAETDERHSARPWVSHWMPLPSPPASLTKEQPK